jgi:hypothetical protein
MHTDKPYLISAILRLSTRSTRRAWAQLLARDPAHDATEEGERQKSLRRRLFAFAHPGAVDFDMLCDRVLTSYGSQKVSPLVRNPRDPH